MNGIFQFFVANPIVLFAVGGAIVVLVLGLQKQGQAASSQSLASLVPGVLLGSTTAAAGAAAMASRVPDVVTAADASSPERGFRVALQVAECLRANGYPEAEVEEFVKSIAAKLLVKKAV